jgi:hypothetical protein
MDISQKEEVVNTIETTELFKTDEIDVNLHMKKAPSISIEAPEKNVEELCLIVDEYNEPVQGVRSASKYEMKS